MEQAFREAEKAFKQKEVPVGAVIVSDGKIIGRGYNMVESLQDPTAHAEIIAITAAANFRNSWRLEQTTLFVTMEPCPMCAGAIYLSRIPEVVFGVRDPRIGACGSVMNLLQNQKLPCNVQVVCGILEAKCLAILQSFFQNLRNRDS